MADARCPPSHFFQRHVQNRRIADDDRTGRAVAQILRRAVALFAAVADVTPAVFLRNECHQCAARKPLHNRCARIGRLPHRQRIRLCADVFLPQRRVRLLAGECVRREIARHLPDRGIAPIAALCKHRHLRSARDCRQHCRIRSHRLTKRRIVRTHPRNVAAS